MDSPTRTPNSDQCMLPVKCDFSLVHHPHLQMEVSSLEIRETLGAPYRIDLLLRLEKNDVLSPDDLLGASCELLLDRNAPLRAIYGCLDEVDTRETDHEGYTLRARVVPALRLLEHEVDSRIFQGLDVPAILAEVLSKSLGAYGRTFENRLRRTYNARDYCVQYQESNLDFCCRLMEEEGITFWFDANEGDKKETLVLADDNDAYGTPVLLAGAEIPVRAFDEATGGDVGDRESIRVARWQGALRPNRFTVRAYNEKLAGVDEASRSAADAKDAVTREVYGYNPGRVIVEDVHGDPHATSFTGEGLRQSHSLATVRWEQAQGETKTLAGTSNVVDLRPGVVFAVGQHPSPEVDGQRFLVVEVTHSLRCEGMNIGTSFENEFRSIPATQPFRPPRRHPKPKLLVSQTATVVGPGGEEIHTDPLGRIRIRFGWDRMSTDHRSSCWVRVVQPWAGPSWGTMFIPRVGMEVVVSFLEGDPDRPIVSGCVYNGANAPPYPLPDEKTKSVIKTSSTPSGNGYNEFTFEDAAGAEQIILHAQKDLSETIENNHETTVHVNQTIGVDGNQTTTVGGNQANTVTQDQTETVSGNVTVSIEGTRTQTTTKKETVTLQDAFELTVGKTQLHQVSDKLTETFDNGRDTTIKNGDTETISTGDKTVDVNSGSLTAGASTKTEIKQTDSHKLLLQDRVDLQTSTDYAVTNGNVSVESFGRVLSLSAADEIQLICGGSFISLKSDGTLTIHGPTKAAIGAAGGSFTADATGICVNGAKISTIATGIHEVMGALVKIN